MSDYLTLIWAVLQKCQISEQSQIIWSIKQVWFAVINSLLFSVYSILYITYPHLLAWLVLPWLEQYEERITNHDRMNSFWVLLQNFYWFMHDLCSNVGLLHKICFRFIFTLWCSIADKKDSRVLLFLSLTSVGVRWSPRRAGKKIVKEMFRVS